MKGIRSEFHKLEEFIIDSGTSREKMETKRKTRKSINDKSL